MNFKRLFAATLVTETMGKNKPEIAQLLIGTDYFKNAINSKLGKVNSQIQALSMDLRYAGQTIVVL